MDVVGIYPCRCVWREGSTGKSTCPCDEEQLFAFTDTTMRDTATPIDAPVSVPYRPTASRVAGLTRRLFALPRFRRPRDLPELTDEWFEETIREVDAASARLASARSVHHADAA